MSSTCWFPVLVENRQSGPPVFVAWILPVLLIFDSCDGFAEYRGKRLLPKHSAAFIYAFLTVCGVLKLPPAAASTSTLSRLRKSSDCTCQALSSNPHLPEHWPLSASSLCRPFFSFFKVLAFPSALHTKGALFRLESSTKKYERENLIRQSCWGSGDVGEVSTTLKMFFTGLLQGPTLKFLSAWLYASLSLLPPSGLKSNYCDDKINSTFPSALPSSEH